MKSDVPLGRIFGIQVGFSWSVLLVAALYVYLLATYEFPSQVLGMSTADYWIAGIAGALAFFACLLAHELGHALMAKRAGIGVKGITLWLLGGVAEMESEADTPGRAFGIAAAGPLTNAALAGVFWLATQALGTSGELFSAPTGVRGLAAVLCAWLAFINLLLAAFNLLPAAPLDGGHLLGAGLWAATGSESTGRLWSSRCGLALGFVLMGVGVVMTVEQSGTAGIWLAVVGWWISGAARSGITHAQVQRRFDGVTLGQIMRPDPPILPEAATIDQVLGSISASQPHAAYLVQAHDGRITGLLTATQIAATDAATRSTVALAHLAFPIDRITLATVADPALARFRQVPDSGVPFVLVMHPNGRVAGTVGNAEISDVWHRRTPRATAPVA